MTTNSNIKETEEKAIQKAKQNKKILSTLISAFGKNTIDLLIEYAFIKNTIKIPHDLSKYDNILVKDLSDKDFEIYSKIRQYNKKFTRLGEIINELKTLGFDVDVKKNEEFVNSKKRKS